MTTAQLQIACCIRDTARYLAQEASEAGLETLAYLLEMTALEAAEAEPARQRNGKKQAAATAH